MKIKPSGRANRLLFSAETSHEVALSVSLRPISLKGLKFILNPSYASKPDKILDPPENFLVAEHKVPGYKTKLEEAAERLSEQLPQYESGSDPRKSLVVGSNEVYEKLAAMRRIVHSIEINVPGLTT